MKLFRNKEELERVVRHSITPIALILASVYDYHDEVIINSIIQGISIGSTVIVTLVWSRRNSRKKLNDGRKSQEAA